MFTSNYANGCIADLSEVHINDLVGSHEYILYFYKLHLNTYVKYINKKVTFGNDLGVATISLPYAWKKGRVVEDFKFAVNIPRYFNANTYIISTT
jgi:hypothetical protein